MHAATACKRLFTHPAAQVDGEDGLLPLLQEEDDHEGEGIGRDAAFSLAVDVTQLQRRGDKKIKEM